LASGNIDILLTARDQYSRQLDEMKSRVRDAQRSVNSTAGQSAGAVEQLARAFRNFGTASAVIGTATAAMGLFRGNTQDAVDALKKMPFGIGPLTNAIEEFLSDLLGVADATNKLKEAEADLAAQRKMHDAAFAQAKKQDESISDIRQRLDDELTLRLTPLVDPQGTEGFERKFEQLKIEQRKAFEQLDSFAKQHTTARQDDEINEARKQLRNVFNARRKELARERDAAIESMKKEAKEREEITNRSLDRVRDRIREQAEDARRDIQKELDAEAKKRDRPIGTERPLAAFESRFLRDAPTSAFPDELVRVRDGMGQLIVLTTSVADKLGYILDKIPEVVMEN